MRNVTVTLTDETTKSLAEFVNKAKKKNPRTTKSETVDRAIVEFIERNEKPCRQKQQ